MRIGIFTDDFYARESGMITSINLLRRGLVEAGHEVFIIAPRPDRKHPLPPDDHVILVKSFSAVVFTGIRSAIPTKSDYRRVVDLELDVVHSMTQHNLGIMASKVARELDIPHVTTYHTMFPELARFYPHRVVLLTYFTKFLYKKWLGIGRQISWPKLRWLYKVPEADKKIFMQDGWELISAFGEVCDGIIVPSRHMGKMLLPHQEFERPMAVIPTGIDVDFFSGDRSRPFMKKKQLEVAVIGRVSEEKRVSTVLDSLADIDNIKLHVVGDGPDLPVCKTRARYLGLERNTVFYGARTRKFVKKILLKCDVLVLASVDFDTQGMVLIEAAAAGTPVVYCDKKLGKSVAPKGSIYSGPTKDNLRQVFERLLAGGYDLEEMSVLSKEFAKSNTYQLFATKTVNFYEKLLGKK